MIAHALREGQQRDIQSRPQVAAEVARLVIFERLPERPKVKRVIISGRLQSCFYMFEESGHALKFGYDDSLILQGRESP